MWRAQPKSTVRIRSASSDFSCSSFKDIQQLCADDSEQFQLHRHPQRAASRKASIFHRVRLAQTLLRAWSARPTDDGPNSSPPPLSATKLGVPEPSISLPGAEKRIVVYFTSLRVVRSTFEDCQAVRSILRGFRVSMDERDLSMDSGFTEELRRILKQPNKAQLTLPRVFIGGRYVGGAEEVRELHEAGELKKLVEGLPAAEPGACEGCGGYRFILCDECNGSHKFYSEKGGFRCCTACNENGLIRCPSCSCAPI